MDVLLDADENINSIPFCFRQKLGEKQVGLYQ
jgi:hypothetical protein